MRLGAINLLAALGLTLPGIAVAQQRALPSVPQALTLSAAVDLARRNNPAFRQAENDLGPARWGVRNAYAAFIPGLNASGYMGYRGAGRQTFLAEEFIQSSSTIGSGYGLDLSLELSGRTLMQPGLAQARRRATEATVSGAAVSLEGYIRQQYLAALQAEAQVRLAELQVRRNDEFLRLAQARFEVGQNTLLDVRQAEVAKGQSDVALLEARQAVTVEKLRLFQTMGVMAPEDPSVVVLTDSFPVIEPAWELGQLLSEADAANPDIMALRAQSAAARASERAAKSTWLPSLFFSAGWSGFTQQFRNVDPLILSAQQSAAAQVQQCQFINDYLLNPGAPQVDCAVLAFTPEQAQVIRDQNDVFPFHFTAQPFSASLTISLPIFTQFSRPLQIAEAAAAADDAREAVRARELQVHTDVSQAYYALKAAFEAINIQQRSRSAADEQLRLATERYRVGSGTFFELLDAQVAGVRAEADYINAIYAYHRSIATLESAVGRPLR